MLESGQLMEKFRHLSRDIQIGIQNSFKELDNLNSSSHPTDKLELSLNQIKEAWDSYYGWILLSSLDNLEEARDNCAPGLIDLRSKIIRSKNQRQNFWKQKGLNIEIQDVGNNIQIQTYIPYFEQLIDLLLDNAIKYSMNGGTIEFVSIRENDQIKLFVTSIGPHIIKHEIDRLGQKGFRSENALKTKISGQGYGLFNVKRIAGLLGAKVSFHPENKIICHTGTVPQSNFVVKLSIPENLKE